LPRSPSIASADESGFGFGGGLFVLGGEVGIDHTILADNEDNNDFAPDLTGFLTVAIDPRFSLIGDNRGSGIAEAPVGSPDAEGNLVGGPLNVPVNPGLDFLADNGGPTLTHALLPNSPAITAGDPALQQGDSGLPEFDQRGAPFARVAGGQIDIGAFEPQPLIGTLKGNFDNDGDTDGFDFLLWQRHFGDTPATQTGGDATGNGTVDDNDLAVWQATYGQQTPPRLT